MTATPPTFRFAPSPNGRLHLGHAFSALLNQRMAERSGGRLLLRSEDIDRARCRPEFEAGIIEDLDWLGIAFADGASRQSEHFDRYAEALRTLIDRRLVYPAFMSRSEIRAFIDGSEPGKSEWLRDPDGAPLYPGVERDWSDARRKHEIASGRPFAWRLDMQKASEFAGPLTWLETSEGETRVAADPLAWGDVILARRDTPTSYHLAVTLDDAAQGVTHVVRGRDLIQATAVHRLLQGLLDLPEPTYHHHPLMLDAEGRKLSKSIGSASLEGLRREGATPGAVRRRLGFA